MSLGVVYENKPEITPSEPDQGNACEGNRPPMCFYNNTGRKHILGFTFRVR